MPVHSAAGAAPSCAARQVPPTGDVNPRTSRLLVLTQVGLRRVLELSGRLAGRAVLAWLDEGAVPSASPGLALPPSGQAHADQALGLKGSATGVLLPARPMLSGGEGDPRNPSLVPMEWAFTPATLGARNTRPVPGLCAPYTGASPVELLGLHVLRTWHFLSDQSWRELATWMSARRIDEAERWRWVHDRASMAPDRRGEVG